jgi:predicted short-subunit dehydrogenase-like oxidoreductase (DUF2520 family)
MRSKLKTEYGIVGAGGVSAGLIGRLPRNAMALGPVGAVSFRVASRIANTLKAGWPVRSLDELDGVRLILFHSPHEHFAVLLEALASARIQWSGKSLVFCDCEAGLAATGRFRQMGASVARIRRCGLPGRLVVEGTPPALTLASSLVRELRFKPVVIGEGCEALFDAAVTLGSAAITPLIDAVARILRHCGVRDAESVQLATGLFARTAGEYAHSGRQSWQWHIEEPAAEELLAQIAAVEASLRPLLTQLVLAGFRTFERHGAVAHALSKSVIPGCPE